MLTHISISTFWKIWTLCMHQKCYYDRYLYCTTWFHTNITIFSCVNLCKSCFFNHKHCAGPLKQSSFELHICLIKALKGTKLQCFLKLVSSTLTPCLNSTTMHVYYLLCMWPLLSSNLWLYRWVEKKTQ